MRSREIARRYAGALYSVAMEEDHVPLIERELRELVDDVGGVPDFPRFLAHPLIPRERKIALLEGAFPTLSPPVKNLVHLMVRNGRESYLDLIYDEFLTARADEERRRRVKVTTAQPLDADEAARLSARLENALGWGITLEIRVDHALLGGVRVEVDGKVIDGTLRAKLGDLRTALER